ncbi:hypothetical protein HMPREF1252_1063 [Peptoniphilus sp. BV3AC2]|nr:hypothetical protein HMPREF1252_1063 [Peptoniphilus sp. BV3AC2]
MYSKQEYDKRKIYKNKGKNLKNILKNTILQNLKKIKL